MKKVLLIGPWRENLGPANVIRALKNTDCSGDMLFVYSKNKIPQLIEIIFKILICQGVIISPITKLGIFAVKIAKLLKKNTAALIHGCVKYECEVNGIQDDFMVSIEQKGLDEVDTIILVSELYMNWYKQYYPQYAYKMKFVNNGFDLSVRPNKEKIPFSVAVMGGNTPIKRNKAVCEAVKELKQYGFTLYVFGTISLKGEELPLDDNIIIMGQLSHTALCNKLDGIETFIVNSDLESFGLAICDAINSRCNILMTRNIGFKSILRSNPNVMIIDNNDESEIAEKIRLLHENGNFKNILSNIDKEECSVETSKNKLLNYDLL